MDINLLDSLTGSLKPVVNPISHRIFVVPPAGAEFLNVNFFARADFSCQIFAPNFEEPILQ